MSENCPSPNVSLSFPDKKNPRENGQKFGIQSVRQVADNLLDQIMAGFRDANFRSKNYFFPLSLLEIHFGMIVIFPLG